MKHVPASPNIAFGPREFISCDGYGRCRVWQVGGVYLGGIGQESVVELVAVDRTPADAGSTESERMLVPEDLLVAGIRGGCVKHWQPIEDALGLRTALSTESEDGQHE